jgi:hypothetical protein
MARPPSSASFVNAAAPDRGHQHLDRYEIVVRRALLHGLNITLIG